MTDNVNADYIHAWQCIGCGRIEAPQPCIGVCKDRRVRFVHADEHEAALARLAAAEAGLELLRKLARTHPRGDGWRVSYLAFQDAARRALSAFPDGGEAAALAPESPSMKATP